MNIYFTQLYVEVGVCFPFSLHFQGWLSSEVSSLVEPAGPYLLKYGSDFSVVFYVSAKSSIEAPLIKGPTIFRKTKDIEYSIFLPFDREYSYEAEGYARPLSQILNCVVAVLDEMKLDVSKLRYNLDKLVHLAAADPSTTDPTK